MANSTPKKWGIDERYYTLLGQLVVAFQQLEQNLAYTGYLLMGGDRRVVECATAEMSFDRLIHFVGSLFKLRIEQFGQRRDDTADLLTAAIGKANIARDVRNRLVHAQWGFDKDLNFVMEKIEAKAKHGLRSVVLNNQPDELVDAIGRIQEANTALMDFCTMFVGLYPELWP